MQYEYGSRPREPYDCICFVKAIAPVLRKDDLVFSYDGSLDWRGNHHMIPLALFRNVCYWKSRRRFEDVRSNTALQVNKRRGKAVGQLVGRRLKEDAIIGALTELASLRGVGIPTASALLTAWDPDHFGIVDFKVRDVLGIPQNDSGQNYLAFRNRLLEIKAGHQELRRCSLRQIELALWHYYPIWKEGRARRPD